VNFRYIRDRDTAEESLGKMSVAVENGVDASKTRGVFSRAFAKRAQPFEEGELFPIESFALPGHRWISAREDE